MQPAPEELIDMYERMLRIRRFEEAVADTITKRGKFMMVHLYIGEEAVAVGVCANLRDDDYVTSTHRGHGHCIAKGLDVKYMMAELYGKKTGTNKGKGGSLHIADVNSGILGAYGIVAGGIPTATGAGLSIKLRKTDQVSISFFGDGATNQGPFHESLNLAAIWKLPVVYVCEYNSYAMSTKSSYAISVQNISERAKAYGIPAVTVDGMDVIAVYEAANEAVKRARIGMGPSLIECKTFRYFGHSGPWELEPYGPRYRTADEIKEWRKKDPISTFEAKLIQAGFLTKEKAKEIDDRINEEMEAAVKFAIDSPDPAPEEALEDLFAD